MNTLSFKTELCYLKLSKQRSYSTFCSDHHCEGGDVFLRKLRVHRVEELHSLFYLQQQQQ